MKSTSNSYKSECDYAELEVDEMKRNPFDPKEKTTCFSFLPPGEGK